MNDNLTNERDLPKKLNLSQPIETTDNLASLTPENTSTVAALQDEVIRLRQEGQPDTRKFPKKGESQQETSDSLTGQVQDYTPLIASLTPNSALNKPETLAGTNSGDTQFLASLTPSKSPVSLSSQEYLIKTAEKPPEAPLRLPSVSPAIEPIDEPPPQSYESIALAPTPAPATTYSSFDARLARSPAPENPNQDAVPATAVAFNTPTKSFEKPAAAQSDLQSPVNPNFTSSPAKREIALTDAPTATNLFGNATPETVVATRSFNSNVASSNPAKPIADAPVLAQNSAAPSVQTAFQNPESPVKNQPANLNATDKSLVASLNQPSENQTTARDLSTPISPTADKPTSIKEQIAFNPVSYPNVQQNAETKQSLVAHEANSSTIRTTVMGQAAPLSERQTVASANVDYSMPIRETNRDLAKEAKDKDIQIANAVNYPKFGGSTPVEESSKPVIQQQTPQSFQSSLARNSAAEKAHPLSESFVSGRILSQPNLSQPNKESQADFKSGDSKTTTAKAADAKITDGKSADVKADAKPSDFKTTDARLPEGRAADPRSLDASHLATSPTAKAGEAHGLHPTGTQPGQALPTDKVMVAAANPATAGKTDNQLAGKNDGNTKPDAAHADASSPDKSGKKPDGVDDKKDATATAKGPGSTADTGKVPGGKSFNDLLDFIDKADQGADIKPGGKANVPLGGSNILSPDDVLITGTAAVGQAGFPGTTEETSNDESDSDKLSHRRKKYIVQPGDTLDSIAKAELGDERFSSLILTINQANIPSKEENGKSIAIKLQPGQILWLPSDHELQVYAELYLLD